MTTRIAFLLWPDVRPLTVGLVEEALELAARHSGDTPYEVRFLQVASDLQPRLPGGHWEGQLERLDRLFVLADEPPRALPPLLAAALRQSARAGVVMGGFSAGVQVLAQLGLLDGHRAAVHWRWLEEFSEQHPKVIATHHLYEWDRDRLTACGGLAILDLLLAMIGRDRDAEQAGAIAEELIVERLREGSERQRIPLKNRLGSSHPKLTQAVMLMEANIEEPLTTDEIAQHVCVSRRQLERIFKQYLARVPSQYYLELRLNRARKMLTQTSKSIIQIGLSCGFSSGPHFSSAYRNFFGVTPRDDRNQRRGASGEGNVMAER
ncbi:GlxA family transcriptional regulator [uncultured Pseudomonas sp.]|uniref:GlxA family transcriptional regulator n=1 Tax=uncultured Pseudomonas sp. TaxID=114707 RepID=UPI0025DC0793|nr:GlxA family transcriptional regulator [uncultured Pseudomonas sp.]